jgi:DNA-binding NtrC family response regulator
MSEPASNGQILVVDDDRNHLRILQGLLEREGYGTVTVLSVDAALPYIERNDLHLILTDLKMPGRSGMDLLAHCRERKPAVPVIMITAHGDIDTAVAAMKLGAYDFITKPVDEPELLNAVRKAVAERAKNREMISAYFDAEASVLPEVIGSAPSITAVLDQARKIAVGDTTVLISGETGVGKELIAKTIHVASGRRDKPFIKVNCAAIPETLAESEFFGHEKGAFTGAAASKPGRFELAHEGTIFLDEIGDMALPIQSRLLGVLQDKTVERVGGVKTLKVDVRVLAATNRDLQTDVSTGRFRADLFYRLNVVPLRIPPLRERRDDILPLLGHFLKKFALRNGKRVARVHPDVTAAFAGYNWPGNIRELENAVERMVLLSETDELGADLLPLELRGQTQDASSASDLKTRVGDIVSTSERQMIVDALKKTGQNRTKAAELLGISRRSLQNKIKEYGL